MKEISYKIIQGDCIEGMKQIPDESVHCVVTSPPYYGLRDYGTATWEGGDVNCDHVEVSVGMSSKNTLGPTKHLPDTNAANVSRIMQYKDICGKCGATRVDKQIGLEETPEAYVEKMVDVFREVRRILRSDGTVWLNLGDSYGKSKQLIGIPWRVAFALQADGWWLRQDIIWHKPNPMPESVTDRCTKSHEYIFLLTKSRRYFYDAEAVREKASGDSGFAKQRISGNAFIRKNKSEYINDASSGHGHDSFIDNGTRNKRSVWTVAPQPYAEAHFAVYPPKLIEPCILAGSPVGGVVFDPFTGSGTTAFVALTNGRSYIGTELNPAYIEIAERRLSRIQPNIL